jgi:chromosome segregation ATPase
MPTIAALDPMPIALAASVFVATNNCEPIWSMRLSGRKFVGSWSIPSGWSRNTSGGFGRENAGSELSGLEGQIGRLRQGIVRLIDSYADGIIEKMEFEPRIARMRERLKQMELQAQNLKDEASLQRELRLILGRLQDFVSKIQEGLHLADWSTRRDIIRALVKRVEIDQEHVHVIFRINPTTPSSPSEKNTQSLQHCGGRDDPALRRSSLGWCKLETV